MRRTPTGGTRFGLGGRRHGVGHAADFVPLPDSGKVADDAPTPFLEFTSCQWNAFSGIDNEEPNRAILL